MNPGPHPSTQITKPHPETSDVSLKLCFRVNNKKILDKNESCVVFEHGD